MVSLAAYTDETCPDGPRPHTRGRLDQAWEFRLKYAQGLVDEWISCQRTWLYLEPIFSSEDIMRQLPTEARRFNSVDQLWKKVAVGRTLDKHGERVTYFWVGKNSTYRVQRVVREEREGGWGTSVRGFSMVHRLLRGRKISDVSRFGTSRIA